MKFKAIIFILLSVSFAALSHAADVSLKKELSPEISNENTEVRTYKGEDDDATITEYRSSGKVWMIKVQPAGDFPPYYLYDDSGDGTFKHRNGVYEKKAPPMWILKRF
jgi:hypothetical protein